MTTLITFLGANTYSTTTYVAPDSDNKRVTTHYIARALAEIYECINVEIIATRVAWEKNGKPLSDALKEINLKPSPHIIPDGQNKQELQDQFRALRNLLATLRNGLVLDITLGYRHQPFFAAAALAVLLAADELPQPAYITYGAFEARNKDNNTTPIFDLSSFIHMMRLAFGISIFRQTGHCNLLIEALRAEERHLRQEKIQGARKEYPKSNTLIGAVERFSHDLSTMRIPALLLGEKKGKSSASLLLKALKSYQGRCDDDHPALVPLLDDLEKMIKPLETNTLFRSQGQRAMSELGNLYLKFSRFAEAAGLGAESLISRYADSYAATDAGRPGFNDKSREEAANRCRISKDNRSLLDIRNDILHCGFRPSPQPAKGLEDNVKRLNDIITKTPRTILVTRHAGAREWVTRQGIVVDEILEHLPPEKIDKTINPGDLVIGSLPVSLVAQICRRGGRYKHLSMNIPPDARGRELSADDMEKFCAKLEEFIIQPAREKDESDS